MDWPELVDPIPSEARALVAGAGAFWGGWGLAAVTLFAHDQAIGVVPLQRSEEADLRFRPSD